MILINDVLMKSKFKTTSVSSPGEGGHGYLKDWLWWGGLLTSKFTV